MRQGRLSVCRGRRREGQPPLKWSVCFLTPKPTLHPTCHLLSAPTTPQKLFTLGSPSPKDTHILASMGLSSLLAMPSSGILPEHRVAYFPHTSPLSLLKHFCFLLHCLPFPIKTRKNVFTLPKAHVLTYPPMRAPQPGFWWTCVMSSSVTEVAVLSTAVSRAPRIRSGMPWAQYLVTH